MEHVYEDGEKREDAHRADGGKDRDKERTRRSKLSFEELLVKYKKEAEVNVTNWPKKIRSSRLPPKCRSQEWNW